MNRSRICVKNLPKYVGEDRIQDLFSRKGEVTDAKLMRTKYYYTLFLFFVFFLFAFCYFVFSGFNRICCYHFLSYGLSLNL